MSFHEKLHVTVISLLKLKAVWQMREFDIMHFAVCTLNVA